MVLPPTSNPMRALLVCALLAAPACQCFEPVEELCVGDGCPPADAGGSADAGAPDAGKTDGGHDGGSDGGARACERWDGGGVGKCSALTGYLFHGTSCGGACVEYPIVTAGVFPTLSACAGGCAAEGHCDTSKLVSVPSGGVISPASYCDDLVVRTQLARLINEAFPGFDAGCVPVGATDSECTLWRRQLGDAGYARACAATLVPRTQYVQCRIYLP